MRVKEYSEDKIVYDRGDSAGYVYLLLSGSAQEVTRSKAIVNWSDEW